ncbi:long-chain fatty acid--CoA ligase [Pseudonocardia sp. EC080610-09]|uniref:fatty acyl-AMP ligase n=1 Tax=unclassified Pseudonocardia TaxID=2619320 RepID=UPI0006CB56C0|nr:MULTISPECIES: fatty acyl-AMP ligase [unclassified Pseudonocardia]ALE75041.1 long-chain fatty acid--CoA ligase [Pseudonocardia sp. EC080625-04]ALL74391.1 long-chain fatty acid--CoA ligase [Pseudonocardia sp. EC080610-09]ALL81413.1 long-chain fatty acid--CoA ligase [Pseudonocardia sp. EC080619-01]
MSRFLAMMLESATGPDRDARGMTTGEPREPVRRSWAEVHRAALASADALRRPGASGEPVLPFGGAVGVLAGEPAEIAPAAQAVWLCGGSVTMLHQPTPRTDLAVWAEDTVTTLKMVDAAMVLLGPPFDALAPVLTEQGVAFRTLDSLDGDPDAFTAAADVADEGDTALLQLTSGSTAAPKAVRITHGNLHANIGSMVTASQLDVATDRMVSWLPLFHDMGMVGFLTVPMTVGLDLVTVTPADFLGRPRLWAELISRYGGTVTAAPNFAYAVLARQLARVDDGELDLSSLRIALNGAEPVDPAAVEAFTAAGARFGLRPESVLCAYGMAETALGVAFAPVHTGLAVDRVDAEELEAHRRATPAGAAPARGFPELGPPLPGIEVKVVGSGGADLGPREVGVLHLRGAAVTPGYLTVEGPLSTQDADGWFDTGDEGYLTDGGAVVVCGRTKDVIIMGGRNIYPTDIERAAGEADGVRAGNVVAVRIAAGEGRHRESFAVAVEAKGADTDDAVKAIRADVVRRVVSAVGVRPAEVAVLAPGSLPKTPSGKLRRAATADLLTAPR